MWFYYPDYALPTHNVEIGNSQKLQAIWQKTFYVMLDIVISTQISKCVKMKTFS